MLFAPWVINATLVGGVQLYYNTEYFISFYFIYFILFIVITILVLAVGSVGYQRDAGRRGVAVLQY